MTLYYFFYPDSKVKGVENSCGTSHKINSIQSSGMALWKATFMMFCQTEKSIIDVLCCIMTFQGKENVHFHEKLRGGDREERKIFFYLLENTFEN